MNDTEKALVRIAEFFDKFDPPSALDKALQRNAALMTDPGYIRRQQQEMEAAEVARRSRANAELAAIGHQSGYAPNLPGQGSALDRAMRALHQPTAQQAAPAPKPAERRAAPASPVNALVGSRPDLLTRALKKGIMLERVKTIQGQRCQTSHCSNNAAWRVNGRLYCNVCAEKLAPR